MKSFKLKLEGPAGCGKDTFMDLVVDKLKDKYNITNKKVSITEMGENQSSSTVKNMEHEWKVKPKTRVTVKDLNKAARDYCSANREIETTKKSWTQLIHEADYSTIYEYYHQ